MIDNPLIDDNREYNYYIDKSYLRSEYDIISSLIPINANIIDLGCGDGSLLIKLKNEKKIEGFGIELSKSGVAISKSKGLNVVEGNIDTILPFDNDFFDFSICNVTIQMVMYPEVLLSEMKRISKFQIISFPNFAFYKNRFDLLFNGRMPEPMLFGYEWYSTGHIHQLSVNDFLEIVKKVGNLNILGKYFIKTTNSFKNFLMFRFSNLFLPIPIFHLTKKC